MKLATIARLTRQHGVKRASHLLSYRALERTIGYMALVGCVTPPDRLAYPRDAAFPDGYEGHFMSFDELREHSRVAANDMDEEFLRRAEGRSDRCYGVFHGDELANYCWYTNRPFDINEHLTVHFDPRYAFVYKCLTQPAHRGKRLHGVAMARAAYAFGDDGGLGIIAYVETRNYPSLRSGRKMGHHEFGVVRVGKVGGRYRSWASPGCAAYGFYVATR
ncbi:hypothetical protein [Haliangium sp.]|uniref:hypothetical protein n=1 Tax=Haliangium sp. TaxID=2663208 RepID=UPI003D0A8520